MSIKYITKRWRVTSVHIRVSNNGTSDGTYTREDGSGKTNQRYWYETLRSLVGYGVPYLRAPMNYSLLVYTTQVNSAFRAR